MVKAIILNIIIKEAEHRIKKLTSQTESLTQVLEKASSSLIEITETMTELGDIFEDFNKPID